MDNIRLATPEEISSIASTSDLGPGCAVWAYENARTGIPDLAVIRQAVEVDPVYYRDGDRRKVAFAFGIETALRMMGVPAYYFNIPATDTTYKAIVEKMGAQETSREPELRFKKVL